MKNIQIDISLIENMVITRYVYKHKTTNIKTIGYLRVFRIPIKATYCLECVGINMPSVKLSIGKCSLYKIFIPLEILSCLNEKLWCDK